MSDLIERLRDFQVSAPTLPSCKACGDAADEIERLRDALRTIAKSQMKAWGDEFQEGINSQAEIALAALEETKGVLDRDE